MPLGEVGGRKPPPPSLPCSAWTMGWALREECGEQAGAGPVQGVGGGGAEGARRPFRSSVQQRSRRSTIA